MKLAGSKEAMSKAELEALKKEWLAQMKAEMKVCPEKS